MNRSAQVDLIERPAKPFATGRNLMRQSIILPAMSLLILVSGCMYELREEMTEFRISNSNKWAAHAAWRDARCSFQGMCCPHSFKAGFLAGYMAVANGSNGCLPAVPDIKCCNHMWLDRCSENDKMEAWYDGYEHGVVAAKVEGMADSNRMTTRSIPQPAGDATAPTQRGTSSPQLAPAPDSPVPPAPITPPIPANPPDTSSGPQASNDYGQSLQ